MNKECYKPIIAITMGDPVGIGPEIAVSTMLDPETHTRCRPFVIGSQAIMERAAKVLNKTLKYNKISDPAQARYELGTLDILETGSYATDTLVFGKVQKLAGQMAFDWIKKSIELGMADQIDGVTTCPINKQAIKLAGVKQDGHTEIYQEMTRAPDALTMFACHKLRVFFLSRHKSLIDACKFVTRENVLDSIILVDKELRKSGMENPLIAVAALNPHGSDGGLFGSEEMDHLLPAVEDANAMGINAVGPIPADSVFHIGKSGAYNAILSLYHDQGHIACKTLDFDRSTTLTFGLPFIRGSVDHGTAFDIAGEGIANPVSLQESIKVIAEYACRAGAAR